MPNFLQKFYKTAFVLLRYEKSRCCCCSFLQLRRIFY